MTPDEASKLLSNTQTDSNSGVKVVMNEKETQALKRQLGALKVTVPLKKYAIGGGS